VTANEPSFSFSEQPLDIAEKNFSKIGIFREMDFWEIQEKFDFLKKDHIFIVLLGVLILLKYGQAETAAEASKRGFFER